ncbi:MAG: hypothetical protein ACK4N5_00310, partial [Myxococcales bacterium]
MSRRHHRHALVGCALVALGAWALWPSPDAPPAVPAAAEPPGGEPGPPIVAGAAAADPAPPAPPAAATVDPPGAVDELVHVARPLIAAIDADPQRPCAGDEVEITVRLRPEAAQAKTSIRGRPGNRAVLVFDTPGVVNVQVLADDWTDGLDAR